MDIVAVERGSSLFPREGAKCLTRNAAITTILQTAPKGKGPAKSYLDANHEHSIPLAWVGYSKLAIEDNDPR
jgi:hypothetical protein